MNKFILATFAALLLGPLIGLEAAEPSRPNILVILVDDMGYSDIGCYGSEIETPNLDKLAANGLRFSEFYNGARCCPSRASLLTGLYPHQTGIGWMKQNLRLPGYMGYLNDRCVTIAEVLNGAGYFTSMTGKWHVGQQKGVTPKSRGFTRSLNAPFGGYYYPGPDTELYLDGEKLPEDSPKVPKDWYSTDLWADFAIKFIDEAIAAKKPFFHYLAFNAPHFPLQAPPEDIAKYRGKYKVGWDKLREQRYRKQIELGLIDNSWPLSPRPEEVQAWDTLSDSEKDRFDTIMAIYAAAVDHMDRAVGKVVEALKQRNVLDNTLILFLSDNGGNAESRTQGRLVGTGAPGSKDSKVFCGESWATLQNTPFRRYKHFDHEGGISTPLIVHWPEKITKPGTLCREPGEIIDIMTTCVDVAKANYPTEFNGNKIQPMEGQSLVPTLSGGHIVRDAIYWEHEGNAAVLVGDWKLVRAGRESAWELYNVKQDRTELNNLAEKEPERVKALAEKWNAWAERTQVMPYPTGGKKKVQSKPEEE